MNEKELKELFDDWIETMDDLELTLSQAQRLVDFKERWFRKVEERSLETKMKCEHCKSTNVMVTDLGAVICHECSWCSAEDE